MPYATWDQAMEHEEAMLGRTIELVNVNVVFFNDADRVEHTVWTLVYSYQSDAGGLQDMRTSYRVAIYVDGRPESSTTAVA
jgi:hypothetical protein